MPASSQLFSNSCAALHCYATLKIIPSFPCENDCEELIFSGFGVKI